MARVISTSGDADAAVLGMALKRARQMESGAIPFTRALVMDDAHITFQQVGAEVRAFVKAPTWYGLGYTGFDPVVPKKLTQSGASGGFKYLSLDGGDEYSFVVSSSMHGANYIVSNGVVTVSGGGPSASVAQLFYVADGKPIFTDIFQYTGFELPPVLKPTDPTGKTAPTSGFARLSVSGNFELINAQCFGPYPAAVVIQTVTARSSIDISGFPNLSLTGDVLQTVKSQSGGTVMNISGKTKESFPTPNAPAFGGGASGGINDVQVGGFTIPIVGPPTSYEPSTAGSLGGSRNGSGVIFLGPAPLIPVPGSEKGSATSVEFFVDGVLDAAEFGAGIDTAPKTASSTAVATLPIVRYLVKTKKSFDVQTLSLKTGKRTTTPGAGTTFYQRSDELVGNPVAITCPKGEVLAAYLVSYGQATTANAIYSTTLRIASATENGVMDTATTIGGDTGTNVISNFTPVSAVDSDYPNYLVFARITKGDRKNYITPFATKGQKYALPVDFLIGSVFVIKNVLVSITDKKMFVLDLKRLIAGAVAKPLMASTDLPGRITGFKYTDGAVRLIYGSQILAVTFAVGDTVVCGKPVALEGTASLRLFVVGTNMSKRYNPPVSGTGYFDPGSYLQAIQPVAFTVSDKPTKSAGYNAYVWESSYHAHYDNPPVPIADVTSISLSDTYSDRMFDIPVIAPPVHAGGTTMSSYGWFTWTSDIINTYITSYPGISTHHRTPSLTVAPLIAWARG